MIAFVALVAMVGPAAPRADAAGVTRYVAPGSGGGGGTAGNPYLGLPYATAQLLPGDTLIMLPGRYEIADAQRKLTLPDGRADARITVKGSPDAVIVSKVAIVDARYWTFDGLRLTGEGGVDPREGVTGVQRSRLELTGGTGWWVRNSEICCWGDYSVVSISGVARDWRFTHNLVWANSGRGRGVDQDHLIYLQTDADSGPGWVERNILAGAREGAAIKLGRGSPGTTGPANVTLTRNTLAGGLYNVRMALNASSMLITDNIMVEATGRPGPGDQAPAAIQPYCLNGRSNRTANDLWWGSVMQKHTGANVGASCDLSGQLADGGGHVRLDPGLDGGNTLGLVAGTYQSATIGSLDPQRFVPAVAEARAWGRFSAFDQVVAGDWNGDGIDTPAGIDGNHVYLSDATTGTVGLGVARQAFAFGRVGNTVVAGDVDGDGRDEIGVFDHATPTFHWRLPDGTVRSQAFGSSTRTYQPVVGDWNGDGTDEVGLYDVADRTFHLRVSATQTRVIRFGSVTQDYQAVAGDHDGDGLDEVGLWNGASSTFAWRACTEATCAAPDSSVVVDPAGDPIRRPVVGRWSAAADRDLVGMVDGTTWHRLTANQSGAPVLTPLSYDG